MKYVLSISLLVLIIYACDRTTERLDAYDIHGIDVSHYQSKIDWDTIAKQDVHFAFVKATEGKTHYDTLFCHNWGEMRRVGIMRGAYHFYRPSISAESQARNFAHWVNMEFGDLPPVLDVEVLEGVSKVSLITGVRTWLFMTELRYNIKPILYTNLKFYNKYLAGHFNDYPIWIARYNNRQPKLACGRDWQFWQYGNRGEITGIEGAVDFNVFQGTMEDLESLCLAPKAILSEKAPSKKSYCPLDLLL